MTVNCCPASQKCTAERFPFTCQAARPGKFWKRDSDTRPGFGSEFRSDSGRRLWTRSRGLARYPHEQTPQAL